jgi:RNase adaptor protein for sRNA GlmZ degradation
MININVKNIQDGKIVSNIKEVIGVHATFVRHDEANKLIENYDLQRRLHPLAEIESDNEIISDSFDDTLENIQLQEYLTGE